MRITMVGSGYVGLVSGACFAQFGHDVICVDKDPAKIEKLKQGEMPIYEPGLDKLVLDNMKAGRLSFSTRLADSVAGADAVFIAVGAGHGIGEFGAEAQAARLHVVEHELVEAGLVDRHLALEQAGDLALLLVDADDVMAELGEAGAGHQSDIALSLIHI